MARPKKTRPRRRPQPKPRRVTQSRKFWISIGAAVAALVAALAVVLLNSESDKSDAFVQQGPVHVHGLGVNPSDGVLYIATHTGMWRLPPGSANPEPVGRSRQDTMGFTVVGPSHFLGSGHPDNFEQPSLLGLIESSDSGATWKPISLLGEADFHVLRAVAGRVYGYDVSNSRLMVSLDGGRTWVQHAARAPIIDLVPDPQAPERLVAATGEGLVVSSDAGASWKRVGRAVGLLAWPTRGQLYLVSGGGDVLVSRNRGRVWRRVGTIGGQPAAFMARTPRELYAALHDGVVVRSRDGGRTWRRLSS